MGPDRELDRLVTELNASGIKRPAEASRLEEWLAILRTRAASDLYLVAGVPPTIRLKRVVCPLAEPPVDPAPTRGPVAPKPARPSHPASRPPPRQGIGLCGCRVVEPADPARHTGLARC